MKQHITAFLALAAVPLLILGAAPSSGPSGKKAGDSITFTSQAMRVGFARRQKLIMNMSFDLQMRKGETVVGRSTFRSTRREEMTEKVLSVASGRASSVLLTWHEAEEESAQNERTKRKDLPHSGKSYVVEKTDGNLKVRYRAGGEPTPKERRAAQKDAAFLKNRDPLRETLLGRTLRVGEPAGFLEEGLLEAFARGNKRKQPSKTRRISVRLREVQLCGSVRCAHFDVEVDVTVGDKEPMDMDLRGVLIVQDEGAFPLSLELKGPIRLQGSEQAGPAGGRSTCHPPQDINVKGSGELRIELKNRFGM